MHLTKVTLIQIFSYQIWYGSSSDEDRATLIVKITLLIKNKQHLPNEKKNFQRTYRQMSIDVNRKLCDETKEDKKNSQKPFSRKLAPS